MALHDVSKNKLVGNLVFTPNQAAETAIVSQEAYIGGKKVKITLNLKGKNITEELAKQAMVKNLETIAQIAIQFKLGDTEKGERTESLNITNIADQEKTEVTRTFTKQGHATKLESKYSGKLQEIYTTFETYLKNLLEAGAPAAAAAAAPVAAPASPENAAGQVAQDILVPPPPPPPPPKGALIPYNAATALTHPYIRASSANDTAGKHLESVFKDKDDKPVAIEQADRVDTIPLLIASLETQRSNLEVDRLKMLEEGKNTNDIERRLDDINRRIDAYRKIAEGDGDRPPATWMSTNSPRMAFKALTGDPGHPGKELSDKSDQDLRNMAFKKAAKELNIEPARMEQFLSLAGPNAESVSAFRENENELTLKANEHLKSLMTNRNDYITAMQRTKDDFVPALVNHRMQVVTDANGKTLAATSRSGAISDFGHGEISLEELQDYSDLIALSESNKPLDDRQKALVKLYGLESGRFSRAPFNSDKLRRLIVALKGKALKGYGGDALAKDPVIDKFKMGNLLGSNELAKKLGRLSTETLDDKLVDQLAEDLKDVELDSDKLKDIIKTRKEKLATQVLQDLYVHFKTTPASKAKTLYGRTALLDMQKKGKNEHGCVLHERTQGLDMHAIYKLMDGKKVVFDLRDDLVSGLGPYQDEDGTIHMPVSCSDGLQETTLETLFFCTSVQGHTANEGLQKTINDEAMAKLKKLRDSLPPDDPTRAEVDKQIRDLNKSLYASALFRKAFRTPRQAMEVIQTLGGYGSVDCYGGKDRTGYLCAVITDTQLKKILNSGSVPNSSGLLATWQKKLLSKKGVGGGIAFDNAEHTVFKLTGVNLKLYTASKRVSHGVKSALVTLGGTKFSSSPGQMYDTRFNGTPALVSLFDPNALKIPELEPTFSQAINAIEVAFPGFEANPSAVLNKKMTYDQLAQMDEALKSMQKACAQGLKVKPGNPEITTKMKEVTFGLREIERQKEILFKDRLENAKPEIQKTISDTQALIGERTIPIDQRIALLALLESPHEKGKNYFLESYKGILQNYKAWKQVNVEALKTGTYQSQQEKLNVATAKLKKLEEEEGSPEGLQQAQSQITEQLEKLKKLSFLIGELVDQPLQRTALSKFEELLASSTGVDINTQPVFTDRMMEALPGIEGDNTLQRLNTEFEMVQMTAPFLSIDERSLVQQGFQKHSGYNAYFRSVWTPTKDAQGNITSVSWKGDIAKKKVNGEFDKRQLSATIDLAPLKLNTQEKQQAAWKVMKRVCAGKQIEDFLENAKIPKEYRALCTKADPAFWEAIDKLGKDEKATGALFEQGVAVYAEYNAIISDLFKAAIDLKNGIETATAQAFMEDAAIPAGNPRPVFATTISIDKKLEAIMAEGNRKFNQKAGKLPIAQQKKATDLHNEKTEIIKAGLEKPQIRQAIESLQSLLGENYPIDFDMLFSFIQYFQFPGTLDAFNDIVASWSGSTEEKIQKIENFLHLSINDIDDHINIIQKIRMLFFAKAGQLPNTQHVTDGMELAFMDRNELRQIQFGPEARHLAKLDHFEKDEVLKELSPEERELASDSFVDTGYRGAWVKTSWKQEESDKGVKLTWTGGYALPGLTPKLKKFSIDLTPFGKLSKKQKINLITFMKTWSNTEPKDLLKLRAQIIKAYEQNDMNILPKDNDLHLLIQNCGIKGLKNIMTLMDISDKLIMKVEKAILSSLMELGH